MKTSNGMQQQHRSSHPYSADPLPLPRNRGRARTGTSTLSAGWNSGDSFTHQPDASLQTGEPGRDPRHAAPALPQPGSVAAYPAVPATPPPQRPNLEATVVLRRPKTRIATLDRGEKTVVQAPRPEAGPAASTQHSTTSDLTYALCFVALAVGTMSAFVASLIVAEMAPLLALALILGAGIGTVVLLVACDVPVAVAPTHVYTPLPKRHTVTIPPVYFGRGDRSRSN